MLKKPLFLIVKKGIGHLALMLIYAADIHYPSLGSAIHHIANQKNTYTKQIGLLRKKLPFFKKQNTT